ncbi:HD domain-containing protein [Candidatus Saccharibacteria bacterium]|nr:HD domain-containing protein [Candidatus Saccharibacteria bacterium]
MHDITETRTGDVQSMSRMYTTRDEKLAITDQTTDITLSAELRALWHEYEARQTLASQIVKDADNLDCELECVESTARGETFGRKIQKNIRTTIRDRLFTDSAKTLYDAIQTGDPLDWFVHGRGRHTHGDWKKA